MKSVWLLIFGLVCGFLGAGLLLLVAGPPLGRPVELLPPPTPLPLAVHVDGAVAHPGLYRLPAGSRVQDAIQAAGGLSSTVASGHINLAALLKDGEQILVPDRSSTPTALPLRASNPTATRRPASPTPTRIAGKINLNTATAAELESLPGIGPSLAQGIIDYRLRHGKFKKIEDIIEVYGIGQKTFDRIKNLITV